MVWTQAEVKQSGVYWLTILINILTVLQYLPPRLFTDEKCFRSVGDCKRTIRLQQVTPSGFGADHQTLVCPSELRVR